MVTDCMRTLSSPHKTKNMKGIAYNWGEGRYCGERLVRPIGQLLIINVIIIKPESRMRDLARVNG